MKSLKLIVAVLVGGVFLAVGYTVAMSGEIPATIKVPATITVKDPAFTTLKKTPVPFSHEKHFKDMNIACTDCHHIFKDGKNVWKEGDPVKKCSECHKPVATEKNSLTFCKKAYPAGKAPGLKCAYHMNCIACHKKAKEAGKKRAPTECSKCHPIQK